MNIKTITSIILINTLLILTVLPVHASQNNIPNYTKAKLEIDVTTPTGELITLNTDNKAVKVTNTVDNYKEAKISVILEIAPDGDTNIVNSIPFKSNTTIGGITQNIYWKGEVIITYSYDNSTGFGCLSKVQGKWIQLRGDTYLTNRSVFYAQSGLTGSSGTHNYYENSFYHYTGFKSQKILMVGATSSADICRSNTSSKIRIEARVSFSF